MKSTAIITAFMAVSTPALAENERLWVGNTEPAFVRMHEPIVPHAYATVTFQNRMVHNNSETFSLTWGEVTIGVDFMFNVDPSGSERITVHVPAGYIAIPGEITVSEDQTDVIHIIEWVGS